jgi:hypothetical protein
MPISVAQRNQFVSNGVDATQDLSQAFILRTLTGTIGVTLF